MATIILERNQILDKTYVQLPQYIVTKLNDALIKYGNYKTSKGYKRLKHLIDTSYNNRGSVNGSVTTQIPYGELVRIKNIFAKISDKSDNNIEYLLNGGSDMENFVNKEVKSRQNMVSNRLKELKKEKKVMKPSEVTKKPMKEPVIKKGDIYIKN